MNRRKFLTKSAVGAAAGLSVLAPKRAQCSEKRPNILLVMSDDQSWLHASVYGCEFVQTPHFDRVARNGVLFNHAYAAAPGCSPSRAALLTGRNIWEIEEAAAHASIFPKKLTVYPDLLAQAGYHVGHTGKGWGPGSSEAGGRKHNPAGPEYNEHPLENPPLSGIATNSDYLRNIDMFFDARPANTPFCLWVGSREGHRPFEPGSGHRAGKLIGDVTVPAFLPDTPEVRSDFLDYAAEIEYFDATLGRILDKLEAIGELNNTLIAVTSDNGMGFPRAKGDLYEYGTRMPLAIAWGEGIKGGRVVDDLVSLIDFAPTFLEAAGLEAPSEMTGQSLMPILKSKKSGLVDSSRTHVLTGKERHSHQRHDNLGYPARAIRTREYLYIWNPKPDRWPGGDSYQNIDSDKAKAGATTSSIMKARKDFPSIRKLLDLAYAKRPGEELYRVAGDLECLHNLAGDSAYRNVLERLRKQLRKALREQGDPRILGYGDVFESYPRFLSMNPDLPGFKVKGEYNDEYWDKAQAAYAKITGGLKLERNMQH